MGSNDCDWDRCRCLSGENWKCRHGSHRFVERGGDALYHDAWGYVDVDRNYECGEKSRFDRCHDEGTQTGFAFFISGYSAEHEANEYIAANIIANVLGLGWAATPYGLKAMAALREWQKENGETGNVASTDMCTFLIINISSLQLIPVNIIAYRSQYGSVSPTSILGMGLVATLFSTAAGVLFSVIARKCTKRREGGKV